MAVVHRTASIRLSKQGEGRRFDGEETPRYADVEADFLMQALGLIPKSVELAIETLPGSDQKSTCACTEGTRCCAGVCQPCQGG